jgi:hypothetical protein
MICSVAFAQMQTPRTSPKASVSQTVGVTDITVAYCRPGVKNRTIWGELVPYDKIWRTGANEATTISFNSDVRIEDQVLPAGTYALFTIPGKAEWTIIFNKNAKQWGANDYKQEQDALRVKVKPEEVSHQEWMAFSFQNLTPDSADVVLRWEKVQVKFGVQVDTKNIVMARCREAMPKLKTDDWDTPNGCAEYALKNGGDTAEIMQWVDKALSVKENFWNLSLKAEVLAKAGKRQQALESAKKALNMTKDIPEEDVTALKKKVDEWSAAKG